MDKRKRETIRLGKSEKQICRRYLTNLILNYLGRNELDVDFHKLMMMTEKGVEINENVDEIVLHHNELLQSHNTECTHKMFFIINNFKSIFLHFFKSPK